MVAKKAKPAASPPAGEQQEPGPIGKWGAAAAEEESFSTDTVQGSKLPPTERPDMGGVDTEEQRKVEAAAAEHRAAEAAKPAAQEPWTINVPELVSEVEKIEGFNEQIGALQDDRKEIFDGLKAKGYKVGIIRQVLVRRAKDPEKIKELDAQLRQYEEALR